MDRTRIGILGGGIAGLTSAYYLARSGFKPVVMEPSSDLGGLRPQIDHEGVLVDRTPHSILNTDTAVCGLLAELGAIGRLTWRPTKTGVLVGCQAWEAKSPLDVIRATSMPLTQRARLTAGLLYATRLQGYTLHLSNIPAAQWLPRIFGQHAFDDLWAPYLQRRYGEYADRVPAYQIWQELKRIHTQRRRASGYVRGGPRWLAEKLRRNIEEAGGEVRLHAQLGGVDADSNGCTVEIDGRTRHFDALINTMTPDTFSRFARGHVERIAKASELPQQGSIIALAISRHSLSPYHDTLVLDEDVPFRTILESTRVIPSRQCGGKHLTYLISHCDPSDDGFTLPDDVVRKQVVENLVKCYSDFDPADLEAIHVTRVAEAEPIFTVDNLHDRRPGFRANGVPLYLCTPAQAYPRNAGWDAEITLAREVAGVVRSQHG
ncbi:MAG: NAD(P)-binding protein [bacterium]|nr:NAD(P)-binding protein [bacterium]